MKRRQWAKVLRGHGLKGEDMILVAFAGTEHVIDIPEAKILFFALREALWEAGEKWVTVRQ